MKRVGSLWPRVIALENLLEAYRKARLGKRRRREVSDFTADLECELVALRRALDDGLYRPGPFRHFEVRDPKPRLISAAPFRDRVVHHALVQVIEPVFERRFSPYSYASRAGRGAHAALDRCTEWMRRRPFVLKCDVQKFFPSVVHSVLLDRVARAVKDPRVLDLVRVIVEHGGPRGLPIGNQTSQFLGNVLLDSLDHAMTDGLGVDGWVRYCDDFLAFGRTRAELAAVREAARAHLEGLGLSLHPRKCGIHRSRDGIDFLGFHVRPHCRRLRAGSKRRARARRRHMASAYAAGGLDPAQATARVKAWVAHVRHGDSANLRAALLGSVCLRIDGDASA